MGWYGDAPGMNGTGDDGARPRPAAGGLGIRTASGLGIRAPACNGDCNGDCTGDCTGEPVGEADKDTAGAPGEPKGLGDNEGNTDGTAGVRADAFEDAACGTIIERPPGNACGIVNDPCRDGEPD